MRLLLKQIRQQASGCRIYVIFAGISHAISNTRNTMQQRNILLLLILLITGHFPLHGQGNYSFTHINGENGLSASNVKVILQDSYGFMWFGTKNGLNRYDGTSILQLDCDDLKAGKGNHNISALYEDKDRNLWVGTDRGIYIYNPASDIFTIVEQRTPEGIAPGNWVQEIVGDPQGNIWALVPDQGVFRFHDGKMDYYPITDKNNFKTETPTCISISPQGDVWLGSSGIGLFRYDAHNNNFEQRLTDSNGRPLQGISMTSICHRDEQLIIAVQDGKLMKYDPESNRISQLPFAVGEQTYLSDVMCFGDEIWVGTNRGLYIINERKQQITHLKEDFMRSFSLSDNAIYYIYRDHEGGTWIGTMFGGVNYLPYHQMAFEKYVPGSDANSLNSKRIRGLAEDANGNIWIGTEDAGISLLDPRTGKVRRTPHSNLDHQLTLFMENYNGNIYTGFFQQGVDVINLPGERIHNICNPIEGTDNSVYSFLVDSKGNQWAGLGWGLYKKQPGGEQYTRVNEIGFDWIFDIMEADDGTIWLASMGNGIWKCDPGKNLFRNYCYVEGQPNGLTSNSISSIMQDSKGNIWFSTDRGGICRYNKETDNFTSFSTREGLPDDVAYSILEDKRGNLWFGTNKGLVRFNPEDGKARVFTTKDGLLGNQFNYGAALKAGDGRFYFGGVEGLIAFDPNTEEVSRDLPPIYISRFSIYNKEVTVHTQNSPLKQCITHTDKITLPYDQANLSFDAALLSYSTTETNKYSYRMDPIDKDWIPAAGNRNISYAKLPPGSYTFRVRATHNGAPGKQATRSLSIVILPPWWQSTGAYIAYTLLVVLMLTGWFLWYKRRKEKQMHEQQKLFAIEKEKELYESKVEFFTEIAHEIRTPLTLINSPLEAIEEIGVQDKRISKYLWVMGQNTKRLLELTGQLLDFQKIGANKLTMKFASVDITAMLQEIMDRFEAAITLNKKELLRNLPEEEVWAAVDKEAVTKIMSNLLNNALKYARQTILVELSKDDATFTIRVTSDSERISPEAGQHIFEPFYQLDKKEGDVNGVGIGLPLARSLATLHKGTLTLDKSPDQEGNSFVLNIPLNKEGIQLSNDLNLKKDIVVMEEETTVSTNLLSHTLLLVEDNEAMCDFISERLRETFTVETAPNGEKALEILHSCHIDLIISDVMMPVMNGYELCRAVKSDLDLSHIPVIFLTAKNDLNSKINGLKQGAEAYVEKPFSFNYLKEQVLSLLDNRRREREAFSKRPFFTVDNMQMNKSDEEFMSKVIGIIEENITDDGFGVERMAEILCMSRSSLLRKIKTLFNLSPVDFIRLIKLKKAAELIQEGKHRIGDVCFLVGINSTSYFSKIFLKQFGMTPKDFEKQCRNGAQIILTTTPEDTKK